MRIEHLTESYDRELILLREYLLHQPPAMDPYTMMEVDPDWVQGFAETKGLPIPNEENPEEIYKWPDELFYELANDMKEEVGEWLLHHDPARAPSWMYMNLNSKKVLPRETWLIHFTDHGPSLQQEGFTRGVMDIDLLGLTTHLPDVDKMDPGFNFAYRAEWKYQWDRPYAVMFQSSGIEVFHNGDQEKQIIFCGNRVNPRDIILLRVSRYGWSVEQSVFSNRDEPHSGEAIFYDENPDKVKKWVMNNWRQYSHLITGR